MPPTQQNRLSQALKESLDGLAIAERSAEAIDKAIGGNVKTQLDKAVKVTSNKGDNLSLETIFQQMGFSTFEGNGTLLGVFQLFLNLMQAVPIILSAGEPAKHRSVQFWNVLFPNQNLSNIDAFLAKSRKLIGDNKYLEILAESGLYREHISTFEDIARPRATDSELIHASFRGEITELEMLDELQKRGFTKNDVLSKISVNKFAIQPQDLIRLAVKEAYSPDAIERFNLNEAFPTEIIEDAKKVGMNEEQLRLFWRGHWNLPSAFQGFEMFQRLRDPKDPNFFSRDDLRELLKFLDFPEPFRDRLEAIARPRLPRVDIRRAFRAGSLTAFEVSEKYKDLGYDDANTAILTNIAITTGLSDEKELSRAAIQDLYEERELSRSIAVQAIQDSGYSATAAEFYVQLSDFKVARDELKEDLDNINQRYIDFVIDNNQLEAELGALNLSSNRKDSLARKWIRQRFRKLRIPSRSDLENWYERDIIDGNTFETRIKQNGYNNNDAKNYRENIEIELVEKARKESERASKELERTRNDEFATIQRLEKVSLQVEIAELNVNIAEIKVALHEDLAEDIEADLKLFIDEFKLLKTIIQVDIARLPLTTIEGDVNVAS